MLLTESLDKTKILQWQAATWNDYLRYRNDLTKQRVRIFFDGNYFWIDQGIDGMGAEGINHAKVSQGERVFAFQLDNDGKYQQCNESTVLTGLPIYLIEQALQQLKVGTNISVATWFSQAIANLT